VITSRGIVGEMAILRQLTHRPTLPVLFVHERSGTLGYPQTLVFLTVAEPWHLLYTRSVPGTRREPQMFSREILD
jgi:hypothetical protein